MRSSDGDVKSFFRQQKAHSGAAAAIKPTGGVSKKAAGNHQKTPAAALLHLTPDHCDVADARKEAEEERRERAACEFDMDMRYGPCLGLTRAQRWRRAAALGLAPPPAALCPDDQPCLWEGRV
ncbi:DNA polymerase delta subunit 4 [Brachypodium distachyon]|uniref:Uncharacterized protein n=1 Tax=Brachypodium distachyon TaxID=15368 RepID=I1I197_BRADI|nr:DNA polymerase delta subunit 4 [Brachypodium distachyon]KQJ95248.1 hypothetical protein BRADI_3g16030v3 [Brachypodium distachyon]|eukprot:XP_003573434.1 DNA polymerase delta subunit 4 [Brachypodium distachyon]